MAEQEKTERATPKRQQEAREQGQVPRSRDLTTMAMLVVSALTLTMIGDRIVAALLDLMREGFSLPRARLMDPDTLVLSFRAAVIDGLLALAPFLVIVTATALLAPMALSGWTFSTKALAFRLEKLDPIKGLGRLFSRRGLVELLKSLVKFAVVLSVALVLLWNDVNTLLGLGAEPTTAAFAHSGHTLIKGFLILSGAMVLIAAVDVPFQLWEHQRQLRMSRHELREELRQTEGSPEMRRRIKEVQRELARRRMMEEVPKADVVVTNPTHYAVALRYDQRRMAAPIVVAKGKDLVALQIRNVAVKHQVPILSAPPLARALYHSTELQQEIPSGLFLAVAQILAYAYQLRRRRRRAPEAPADFNDLPIPDDLRHDE